jgi:hypothetical protein
MSKTTKRLTLAQETLRNLTYDESFTMPLDTTLPVCPTGVPPVPTHGC